MRLVLAVAAAALLSSAALAQNVSSPGTDGSNRTVAIKPGNDPESTGAIVPGANSFTEGQARSRMEAHGFADVSDLRKDSRGIWHGRAMRNGRKVEVLLDYRGNIASGQAFAGP